MPDYRIYCLDGAGHIGFADWIQADTDAAAVEQARKLKPDAHRCEVWRKDRLVAKINANGHLDLVSF